jgi:hypothetical protein
VWFNFFQIPNILKLIENGVLAGLGVDVLVSLENTYFQLDSYFATSISSKLRYLDAEKSPGGRLTMDHLRIQTFTEQAETIQIRTLMLPMWGSFMSSLDQDEVDC